MTTLVVTYAGNSETPFDRQYYVDNHLPLVEECWKPYGLLSATAFFPSGHGAGIIAVCLCQFRDEKAMADAISSSHSRRVMADVEHFTLVKPSQSRLMLR